MAGETAKRIGGTDSDEVMKKVSYDNQAALSETSSDAGYAREQRLPAATGHRRAIFRLRGAKYPIFSGRSGLVGHAPRPLATLLAQSSPASTACTVPSPMRKGRFTREPGPDASRHHSERGQGRARASWVNAGGASGWYAMDPCRQSGANGRSGEGCPGSTRKVPVTEREGCALSSRCR